MRGPEVRAGSLRRGCAGWLLLLASVLFLPAAPAWGEPPTSKVEPAGTLATNVPAPEAVKPDDPEAAARVKAKVGVLDGADLDWHDHYVRSPGDALSPAAEATLGLARDQGYGRAQAVADLAAGGTLVKPLIRNLDVGRHEVMKHLYHRAMVLANADLEARGLSLLQKVQAVNAGGTGDYTRDQDITVFAGDEVREQAFFEGIQAAAKELGLTIDPKPTGGIDFPEIEVTFFPGNNDLPDARFATDVEDFALKYQVAIAKQAADLEAYKGGGADIEVKGRRIPGKMYVQQLTWEGGHPVYVAETPQNFREARSIFTGTAPERWQRFERAAHIFSDFVQGRQHAAGTDHNPTKGPLKYAGRAIEHLCELRGMRPWPELKPEDRTALLRRVWPQFDPKTPRGARVLAQISEAIDVSVHVKTHKELPKGKSPQQAHVAEGMALRFLSTATAATAGEMARDLLYPPAFDTKTMRESAGKAWDTMTPEQRYEYARKRDKVFRAATGRAAMENLLVTVSMLRNMDFQDGQPAKRRPGLRAMQRLVSDANPSMRPVLQLASEYAEAWARKQQTSDPKVHAECDAEMARVRKKLVAHCPQAPGGMPSEALLAKAAKDGPRAVLAAETKPGRSWLSPEMQELKQAFDEHLRQAFPTTASQWREFREQVKEVGYSGYVARRLVDEFATWDTLGDALTLVELYQGGAGAEDYYRFLGINLVSRVHWGVGPLIQAFMVYDKDPDAAAKKAAELGKSLVFLTLARVVPWAGTAKIAFDVARGIVVVTVGWAVGKANAALVDALYTGEAGRTNMDAAGTWGGRIRDSGICVLPAEHVRRLQRPDTHETVIAIDRAALYRAAFQEWTGVAADDYPRSRPPRGDAAALTMAHDMFVRVLHMQAEQHGPLWVPRPGKPYVPVRLTEREVEAALAQLHPLLRARAEQKVDQVLAETAARSYRSYMESEGVDVIREALVNRYAADLLAGMIEHWQVRLTAQILAAREIERTGVLADWRVVADELHTKYVPSAQRLPPLQMRLEGTRWRPVPRPGGVVLEPTHPDDAPCTLDLEAHVQGVPILQGAAVDGSQPVRVSAVLHGTGETSDVEQPVKIEVTPGKLKRLRKVRPVGEDESSAPPGYEPDGGPIQPGDLVEDRVVVRALAADGAGPELARRELVVRVLLPVEGQNRGIPLLRRTEYRRDGSIKERYVFFQRFDGMPSEWATENGEVYHGLYEEFHADGTTPSQTRTFAFGVLDGPCETFNLSGKLIHTQPWVKGEIHGEDIRYDPDSVARLVTRIEHGTVVEQTGTNTSGGPYVKVTYRWAPREDGVPVASGEAARWWLNGNPRWHGSFADAFPELNTQGGQNAESVSGKTGVWEWFYENGKLQERTTYVAGRADGPTETFDEEGRPVATGTLVGSERVGAWKVYDPPGTLHLKATYALRDGCSVLDGPYEDHDRWGGMQRGQYDEGRREGTWRAIGADGKVSSEWSYAADEMQGIEHRFFEDGSVQLEVPWVAGKVQGTRREWTLDAQGRRVLQSEAQFREGEQDGPYVDYHPNGTPKEKGSYQRGKAHGPCSRMNPEGVVVEETMLVQGVREGPATEYDDKGRVNGRGSYHDDAKHGTWEYTTYDSKGEPKTSSRTYGDGR